MVHVHDVLTPNGMKELTTIVAEYKIWFELALTVKNGFKPVLNAAVKGKLAVVHPLQGARKAWLYIVSTPDLNKLLKRV